MIDEKEININGKTYYISKLPATVGREVLYKYPTSLIPKIADYAANNEIMLKLLSFVEVDNGQGGRIALKTEALINNHVKSATDLIQLEREMFTYNFVFFTNGTASTFLQKLETSAVAKGTEILTILLDKLSQAAKQR